MFFQMLLLAFTLSIDSFGIGFAYELKGVRISIYIRMLIGLISASAMGCSMLFGSFLQQWIPKELQGVISALIFIGLGVVFLRNSLLCCADKTYDLNASKRIEGKEGILLGLTLSLDSVVAGVAVASVGFWAVFLCVFLGFFQVVMSSIGCQLARKSMKILHLSHRFGGILSGIFLITLGIIWLL